MTPVQRKRKAALLKYGVRSGLEADTVEHLNAKGVSFEYEEHKIKWVDHKVRSYKPDFVLSNGIIVETKGRFTAADRRKHIEINKQQPLLDIRFVFSNANSKLDKRSKTMYRQWCDRKGFKWANKVIPDEWLEEPEVDFRIEDIRYEK